MGVLAGVFGALVGAASGAAVFEELRFVWEYLAAAMLFLSAQVPARRHAALHGVAIVATFSLLCLLYFPFRDAAEAWDLPNVVFVGWYLALVFAMTLSLRWCFRISVPDLLWTATTSYVAQHIVYVLIHEMLALWLWPWLAERLPLYVALSVCCCVVVYLALYRLFLNSFRRTAGTLLKDEPYGVVTTSLVLAALFSSTFGFQSLFQTEGNRATSVWMDLLVCGMLLGLQYTSYRAIVASRETQTTEQMLQDAAAHWELSHALASRLGTFMHDVWHLVLGVKVAEVPGLEGYLDRVEKELGNYQSTFYSRNDVLNSVLAGTKVLCRGRGIALTCSVGNVDTGGVPAADLYALIDSMARLAIAAAELVGEPSRRAIDLELGQRAGMLLVSCDIACEEGRDPWQDAAGLRAVGLLVERLDGSFRATSGGGVATLRAAIPMGKPGEGKR